MKNRQFFSSLLLFFLAFFYPLMEERKEATSLGRDGEMVTRSTASFGSAASCEGKKLSIFRIFPLVALSKTRKINLSFE